MASPLRGEVKTIRAMRTDGFTVAEKEVLLGYLEGKKAEAIANDICRGYWTVVKRTASMFEKSGTHSIHELCAVWLREHMGITVEELRRRLGAFILLGLFSAYTFGGACDDQIIRRTRSRRRTETEEIYNL